MKRVEFNKRLLTVFAVIACVVSMCLLSCDKELPTDSAPVEQVPEKTAEQPGDNAEAQTEPEQQAEQEHETDDDKEPVTQNRDGEILSEAEQLPEEWMLILANPWNKLPEDFSVELKDIGGGHKVDARIVDDLNRMMQDLRLAGHSAFVCSSYRTNTKQTTLYKNKVNQYRSSGYADEDAAVEAGKWVAVPGTSEHQTGLAVDIMSSYYLVLDEGQENTAEQQWLMENSYKYGFILRYPSDKSNLTGIYYEPWHYRYVGKNAAKEIYEKDICFEEYLLRLFVEKLTSKGY